MEKKKKGFKNGHEVEPQKPLFVRQSGNKMLKNLEKHLMNLYSSFLTIEFARLPLSIAYMAAPLSHIKYDGH